MKFKINLYLSLISIATIPMIFVSYAESKNVTVNSVSAIPTAQDYYNYIYNRTFSIMAMNDISTVRGTGWLFKHLDDSPTSFHYLMFTNWHVQVGMEDNLSNPSFYYQQVAPQVPANDTPGAEAPAIPSDARPQKISVDTTSYTWFGSNNFKYTGVASYYKDTDNILYGVDAAIAEVSFNPVADTPLYKQLHVLNEQSYSNNMLVNFHSGTLSQGNTLYYAGYPGADWSGAEYRMNLGGEYATQWETSNSTIDSFENLFTKSPPPFSQDVHPVDKDGKKIAMDDDYISQQYDLNSASPMYYLGGGASGSMGLYWNGSQYEVAGLYWGGTWDMSTWFKTATLIYNPGSDYNLYQDFLDDKWIPIPGEFGLIDIIIISSVVGVLVVPGIVLAIVLPIKLRKRKNIKQPS